MAGLLRFGVWFQALIAGLENGFAEVVPTSDWLRIAPRLANGAHGRQKVQVKINGVSAHDPAKRDVQDRNALALPVDRVASGIAKARFQFR